MAGIPQVITEDRASGAQFIDGSLKFRSSTNASGPYLSRTGGVGNRKTWTLSCWIKRNKISASPDQRIFTARNGDGNATQAFLKFQSTDVIQYVDSANSASIATTAKFRDTGWFHLTAVLDASNTTFSIYINGQQQTLTGTQPSNADGSINNSILHAISYDHYSGGTGEHTDTLMSQFYLIDGQALGPEYFGFTDPLTNTWRPKKAEIPGPNDGSTWSSYLTSSTSNFYTGAQGVEKAFDGDTSTYVQQVGGVNPNYITFTPPSGIAHTSTVEVWINNAQNEVSYNGGSLQSISSGWNTIATGSGTLTSIRVERPSTSGAAFGAIRIDGVILIDGDTSNMGTNGFYLPMDGNSLIGKDQSGRGNDWTPVNFTGSVTPDNPTADGALSILKPYKPAGVRTDSKTYTVTASGGNYYLDGALKPTLNLLRGGSYTFDYTGATSHPFYLSSLQDGKHNSKAYSSRLYRSGGYLDLGTGHTDLQPGSGDFCIELYVNLVNQGANYPVFVDTRTTSGDTNGFFWGIRDADNRIYLYTHSGTRISADHSLTTGKWYHLALTRQSGTFRMFIDGSQVGVSYSQSQNYTNQIRYIGYSTNNEAQTWYIDAYISNFRFVKGEAVYTTNFTPPQTTLTTTSQGVSSSNVKLLCCQDSSPTTAVVSPGTITLGQAGSDAVTSVNTHNPFLYNSVHGNFGVNTGTSNTTKITIPHWAADTLYYYCGQHSNMGSSINVTTDAFKVDPYAWKCVVAAPLDKNLDYSDQINVNSSAKTVASFEGSQEYVSNTNFYRSALNLGAASARNSTSISSSNDYFFGLSPWTVEVWAYRTSNTSNSNYMPLWEITGDSGLGVGWLAFLGAEAGVNRFFYGYGSTHTSVTWGLSPINQWVHNAVVFDGQYLMVFEDGFCKNRTAYSSLSGPPAYFGRPAQINLGTQNYSGDGNNRNFAGYVQDFRVFKGVAKYTASAVGDHAYTPASTSPDVLPDTPSGITGKTNLTKITDGAVAFDGSDRLDFDLATGGFGSGDFTLEYFFYQNTLTNYQTHFGVTRGTTGFNVGSQAAGNVVFYDSNGGGSVKLDTGSGKVRVGRWYHVAFVRSGTTITGYLDGVAFGTYTSSVDYSGTDCSIGSIENGGEYTNGIISNFHINVGTALYTSNFIPPTEPLTAVTNTKLLCCQSPTSVTAATVSPGSISSSTLGYAFTTVKIYSVYAGLRAANYTVQYSDDNSNWYDAWSGNMSNNSSCGIQQGTGSGNPGPHQYWRYVEGTATTSHHPRVSRIILSDGTTDVNLVYYGADNCNDSGTYQIGTTGAYTDSTYVDYKAVATNFNPFTDDINAIRGQETGYATLNPLDKNGGSLSDGNLTFTDSGSDGWDNARATIGASKGKFYWEMTVERINQVICASIAGPSGDDASNGARLGYLPGQVDDAGVTYYDDGRLYHADLQSGGQAGWGATYGAGDIISIALDMDDSGGKVWFAKNGIWQASGNPSTGAYAARSDLKTYADTWFPISGTFYANTTQTFNFGQKPFKFPPPDGFQPLNLSTVQPEKVFARPDQYVDAITYSGNNSSSNTVTDLKFNSKPDFVWIKSRSGSSSPNAQNHYLMDSVRGANGASGTSKLYTNNNGAANSGQTATTNGVRFTHNGFELTTNNDGTNSNNNYVAWCWKAGGSEGTFNVDGATYATAAAAGLSAGTMTVTGASVGTKQGFSIVRYTGSGSAGSLAHGLGQKPTFWIVKAIDAANYPNWYAYTEQLDGSLDFMHFHTNEHKFDSAAAAPTSTTIGITSTLGQAVSWITYMWHDVPGLQKFGSFIGNSSQNFVELGFRPAIVWVKRAIANSSSDTSTNNSAWTIMDSTRLSYNGQTPNHLYANHTADEGKRGDGSGTSSLADMTLEPHSNGFYLNGPATETNSNTGKFIYCAWAEAPSINLYGAQSNAR